MCDAVRFGIVYALHGTEWLQRVGCFCVLGTSEHLSILDASRSFLQRIVTSFLFPNCSLGCVGYYTLLHPTIYISNYSSAVQISTQHPALLELAKASLVFLFSCPTKTEMLTEAGRVLNTHPSSLESWPP